MGRMRKHIHRLGFDRAVAAVLQDAKVAGQRGRVARDVHDALRAKLQHRVEQARVAALAGRVDDDDVGRHPGCLPPRQDVFGGADGKFGVGDAVQRGVAASVLDRFGDDLDAVDAARVLGEEQGDRSDAAIGVDHRLLAGEGGVFHRGAIQALGLRRVHLEEGARGDREPDAPDVVVDDVVAP